MRFAVFDADGCVVRIGNAPVDMIPLQAKEGELALPFDIKEGEYYLDSRRMTLHSLKEMKAKVEGIVIKNLPIPTTVVVEGNTFVVEDGEIELEFEFKGEYKVQLSSPIYKPVEVTVRYEG